MIRMSPTLVRVSIGALVCGVLSWNGLSPTNPQASLFSSAEARIGRPLTPMSYAGVARRTTRRAVAVRAMTRPVVVAPVVAPRCARVVDVYGRVTTVCR
jgi:hypothetical protein